jgi:hypothetical protein
VIDLVYPFSIQQPKTHVTALFIGGMSPDLCPPLLGSGVKALMR